MFIPKSTRKRDPKKSLLSQGSFISLCNKYSTIAQDKRKSGLCRFYEKNKIKTMDYLEEGVEIDFEITVTTT